MKHVLKSLGILMYGITFIVAALTLIAFLSVKHYNRPGPLDESKLILINKGASLGLIAEKLEYENAIDSAFFFKIAAHILGSAKDLKAGEYEVAAAASMKDIMVLIKSGKSFQRFITIPEGLTSFEIVRLINAYPRLKGEIITDIPDEGTLMPETYSYDKNETRQDIIKRMQKAMSDLATTPAHELCPHIYQVITLPDTVETKPIAPPAQDACIPEDFENWHQVITMASIVEKETAKAEERATVAGVFANRLKKNIALQTDPTVIYAITKGEHQNKGKVPLGRRLLKKDLAYDSPYTTYKYRGLPPGPIANPGKDSILAVLKPEEHSLYYFVADGTGGHLFASTLEEHNRNVANWRKIRKSKGK